MDFDGRLYSVLSGARLQGEQIRLRGISVSDIELIRRWRNSQKEILRQTSDLTQNEQLEYFESRVWPEVEAKKPAQILLAIETFSGFVGYGGLVHISWPNARAELSFLLADDLEARTELRSGIFYDFLRLVSAVAFGHLGLNRIFTETFEFRTQHIRTLEQAGFRLEGKMRNHVWTGSNYCSSLVHARLADDGDDYAWTA